MVSKFFKVIFSINTEFVKRIFGFHENLNRLNLFNFFIFLFPIIFYLFKANNIYVKILLIPIFLLISYLIFYYSDNWSGVKSISTLRLFFYVIVIHIIYFIPLILSILFR